MKNKEAYKQAFKHVHYQKEVNLNQKRIPKSLITFVTSFIILLSTFTVAYAFDIGGIQSKIEVWFHGEKRMIQYEEVEDHVYHFYTTDEDGNVIDMGTHSGSKGTLTGIEPMSGDELAESMNDNSEIVYDEKEDKLYKVNEYTNMELIYEDEYNCLYHKLDGVYYTKLGSDKEEKLYDYNGEIGLTILEGYVKFQEREIHYNDDIIDKQKIIKVW